ncbi:MAG: membrane protein insertion efficiency factor YidD [Pseudomonadales bacterium]|nr:membrane protein insertion efficiency factor YidD [Pseudomonadales bacterium]MDP6471423.1 membrane protein insertion efficiency factor YidD [Pseudomonadales bacterium]MDP6828592.1 membrane protein insertion efficiency factor YidD [Pseudomonadales bacterium]MDP6972016.1 membrane protein insertion efficiency factor YidD [Pseudomonadales bacterium]
MGVHLNRGLARLLVALVRAYQLTLSSLLGGQCRFHPTCSHYALDALDRHGGVRGGWLICKRLGKCHPFHPGGIDEVPETHQH